MNQLRWIAFVALAAAGCSPVVGDVCELDRQCGTTLTCDTTTPEGYCLKVGCRQGECPPEATCVDFGQEQKFCMRSCAPDNECREGLLCRAGPLCSGQAADGKAPCSLEGKAFCGVAP